MEYSPNISYLIYDFFNPLNINIKFIYSFFNEILESNFDKIKLSNIIFKYEKEKILEYINENYNKFISCFLNIYKSKFDKEQIIMLNNIDKQKEINENFLLFNENIIKQINDNLKKSKIEYFNFEKYDNLDTIKKYSENQNILNQNLTDKINNLLLFYDYECFENFFDRIKYDELYNIDEKDKTLIIGDIHGDFMTLINIISSYYQKYKTREINNIILCGDVFDPFNNGVNICYNEYFGSNEINKKETHKIIKYAAFSQIVLMYVLFYLMFEKNIKIYWVLGNHDLNYGFLYFHSLIFYLYGLDQFYYNSIGIKNEKMKNKIIIASHLTYKKFLIVHEKDHEVITNKETYKHIFNCLYFLFYFQKIKIKSCYNFVYDSDKIIKGNQKMEEQLKLNKSIICDCTSNYKKEKEEKLKSFLINLFNLMEEKDKKKFNNDNLIVKYKNIMKFYFISSYKIQNLKLEKKIEEIKSFDDIYDLLNLIQKSWFKIKYQNNKDIKKYYDEIKQYNSKINIDSSIKNKKLDNFKLSDLSQVFINEVIDEETYYKRDFILQCDKYNDKKLNSDKNFSFILPIHFMIHNNFCIYGHVFDDKTLNKIILDDTLINLKNQNLNYENLHLQIVDKLNYNVNVEKDKINLCLDYTTSYFKINTNNSSYIRLIKKNLLACKYIKINNLIDEKPHEPYNIFDSFDVYCLIDNKLLAINYESNTIKYLIMSQIKEYFNQIKII